MRIEPDAANFTGALAQINYVQHALYPYPHAIVVRVYRFRRTYEQLRIGGIEMLSCGGGVLYIPEEGKMKINEFVLGRRSCFARY